MDKEYPSISRKFGANLFLTKGIRFFPEGIFTFSVVSDGSLSPEILADLCYIS